MPPPIYASALWKRALELASNLVVILLSFELIFSPVFENLLSRFLLDTVQLLLAGFLVVDIVLHVLNAPHPYSFIRSNFVRLIATMPVAFIVRTLRFFELDQYLKGIAVWELGMNVLRMNTVGRTFLQWRSFLRRRFRI